MLALGGGRDLPAILRPVALIVAIASLAPFGGRAATAFSLLTLTFLGMRQIWRALRGAQFKHVVGAIGIDRDAACSRLRSSWPMNWAHSIP